MVHQSEIDTWNLILNRLSAKCPDETRDKVASLLITGHKLLRDRGSKLDLKEFARLVDESVPAEGVELLDCSAMFTTTIYRGATGQAPLKKANSRATDRENRQLAQRAIHGRVAQL